MTKEVLGESLSGTPIDKSLICKKIFARSQVIFQRLYFASMKSNFVFVYLALLCVVEKYFSVLLSDPKGDFFCEMIYQVL